MSNSTTHTLMAVYTKHKTQKRKVYNDGFLKVNTASGLVTLHAGLAKAPIDSKEMGREELKELLSLEGEEVEFDTHLAR